MATSVVGFGRERDWIRCPGEGRRLIATRKTGRKSKNRRYRGMLQTRRRDRNQKLFFLLISVRLGPAAAVDSFAANTFDGVYSGTQRTILTNNSALCARIATDTVLRIQNNHFSRQWGVANLSVDVAADGSFEAKQFVGGGRATGDPRVVRITGQIADSNLEADIGGTRCAVHLSLKKS